MKILETFDKVKPNKKIKDMFRGLKLDGCEV
jgi:hypothetical protein